MKRYCAPGEIDRVGLRQIRLLVEMGEALALAVKYQARRNSESFMKGRDAIVAERGRAEAAAELGRALDDSGGRRLDREQLRSEVGDPRYPTNKIRSVVRQEAFRIRRAIT